MLAVCPSVIAPGRADEGPIRAMSRATVFDDVRPAPTKAHRLVAHHRVRRRARVLGIILWLMWAHSAQAQDEPAAHNGADLVALDDMQQLLAHVDAQARRLSFGLSVANTTVGIAHAIGGAFAAKHHAFGSAVGTFVGASFSAATGMVGFTLGRAPFRRVYEGFLARRNTLPAAVAIAQTERLWQSEAEAVGKFRTLSGMVLSGVGAGLLGFSTAALIADLRMPSKNADTNSRASLQGALLGLSGLLFVNGVTLMVSPGPIESSWQSYALSRAARTAPRASLQLTPVRQGVSVGMALHF